MKIAQITQTATSSERLRKPIARELATRSAIHAADSNTITPSSALSICSSRTRAPRRAQSHPVETLAARI